MVLNLLSLQHNTDNINLLSNAEMADVHMAYILAIGNARMDARLHEQRFLNCYLPGHRMITNLHQRLCETASFSANRIAADRSRRIGVENEEEILQHFRENPRMSIRAVTNRLRIASFSKV